MTLQREALKARRAYMNERKRQMEALGGRIPNNNFSGSVSTVGFGPPIQALESSSG